MGKGKTAINEPEQVQRRTTMALRWKVIPANPQNPSHSKLQQAVYCQQATRRWIEWQDVEIVDTSLNDIEELL